MRKSWLTIATLLGLSGGLCVAGVIESYAELSPYFALGSSIQQKHAALGDRATSPALSSFSRGNFLSDCMTVLQSPVSIVQTADATSRFLTACSDLGTQIGEDMPSNAQAWLVAAATQAALSNAEDFNRFLLASRRTAPFVQWLASQRVALAEANYGLLDEAGRRAEIDDFHALMESSEGIGSLAATYVGRPAARERITAVMETAPAGAQAFFLSLVQKAAGR